MVFEDVAPLGSGELLDERGWIGKQAEYGGLIGCVVRLEAVDLANTEHEVVRVACAAA